MNRNLLITFAIFFSLSGCADQKEENNGLIVIDVENAIDSQPIGLPLDEFISSIRYVPLETNGVISINEITQIQFYRNHFFVLDYEGLYKFDSDGKFIFKIGNKGRGPDEYVFHHEQRTLTINFTELKL